MNEIVNKFLLQREKFFHQIHLRQPKIIYSACGPFTRNKGGIQKFKETKNSRNILLKQIS